MMFLLSMIIKRLRNFADAINYLRLNTYRYENKVLLPFVGHGIGHVVYGFAPRVRAGRE